MITANYRGKNRTVEYSIVNLSELEGELRIDAEYYDPVYLRNEEQIKKKNWLYLKEITYFYVNGVEIRTYYPTGIPYLRVSDMQPFFLDLNDVVFVHQKTKIKASIKLEESDILVSRSGTLGIAVIVDARLKESIISSHLIRIKPVIEKINPYYLVAFLNSKYGVNSILQKNNGAVVPEINHTGLDFVKVPIPSVDFQKFIEEIVLRAYNERERAEQLYKEAEKILLRELGLDNWSPKKKVVKIGGREFCEEENISVRMLSEVLRAERMDAEYWEPKYDEIEELIKNYRNGWGYLEELVEISKKKIRVEAHKLYNYIELANVDQGIGIVNNTQQIVGNELPSRARMMVRQGYVIMSSVKGSIDKIALIDLAMENLVASTGFFILKEKANKVIGKETLLVLLKVLAKKYLIREAQGTILQAIPYTSLQRIILPKVVPHIQEKISQLIQQSFKARRSSEKLLEIAKRAVEIYIDNNEEEGIKYAKDSLEELLGKSTP